MGKSIDKLRKLYSYDLAKYKWADKGNFESEKDELETLAVFHLNHTLANAAEEYFDLAGSEPAQIAVVAASLQKFYLHLVRNLKEEDRQAALALIKNFCKE
jgi:hypothetical protein